MRNSYSEVTPYIAALAEKSCQNNGIAPEMYAEHRVNRGLRDVAGNGVVTGLTEVSAITSKRTDGWSAHRIEEIQNAGKIIRPAYINVKQEREYIRLEDR